MRRHRILKLANNTVKMQPTSVFVAFSTTTIGHQMFELKTLWIYGPRLTEYPGNQYRAEVKHDHGRGK
jgi:hypothetical protein